MVFNLTHFLFLKESDTGVLFALYIDDLLYELEQCGFWDDQFVGALAYADDLTLLAPSPAALRRLLFICEQFEAANMLKFNPDKVYQIFM